MRATTPLRQRIRDNIEAIKEHLDPPADVDVHPMAIAAIRRIADTSDQDALNKIARSARALRGLIRGKIDFARLDVELENAIRIALKEKPRSDARRCLFAARFARDLLRHLGHVPKTSADGTCVLLAELLYEAATGEEVSAQKAVMKVLKESDQDSITVLLGDAEGVLSGLDIDRLLDAMRI